MSEVNRLGNSLQATAIRYTAQSLSPAQQAQARTNIGATAGSALDGAAIVALLDAELGSDEWQGGGGGSGTVLTGKKLWVDKVNGDDATAVVGRQDLACDTIQGAIDKFQTMYFHQATNSLVVGTGSKTFTVASGMAFVAGERVRAYVTGSSAFIEGAVSSYSGTTLIITADRYSGSGTQTSWDIFLAVNVCVHILPATTAYNEQIVVKRGVDLHGDIGVVIENTDAGSLIIDHNTYHPYQIKFTGPVRCVKRGTAAVQAALEMRSKYSHFDFHWEGLECRIENAANAAAVDFANSSARAAATPTAVGQIGFQVDDSTQWVATGTSEGNWTAMDAAVIKKKNGHLATMRIHNIDGYNCDGVKWTGGGQDATLFWSGCRIMADRIIALGRGCSAVTIGHSSAPTPEQVWFECMELVSLPDELAIRGHHYTTNVVAYFNVHTISGCYADSCDHTLWMLKALLWVPVYDVLSVVPSVTGRGEMIKFAGTNNCAYKFYIQEIENENRTITFSGGTYQADIYVQRLLSNGEDSGEANEVGSIGYEGGNSTVRVDTLMGTLRYNSGNHIFSGRVQSSGTPSITLEASDFKLHNAVLEPNTGVDSIVSSDPGNTSHTIIDLGGCKRFTALSADVTVVNGDWSDL